MNPSSYFEGTAPVTAVPGAGQDQIQIWILGSSLFGARLAAQLGRPYSFASHFAPAQLHEALAVYRSEFRPSKHLDKPYVMLGYNVFAADSDEEAHYLASSWQQSFVRLRSGSPGRLPPPQAGYYESLPEPAQALLDHVLACTAVGALDTVAQQMREFVELTGADELIINSSMFDHAARRRSVDIAARAMNGNTE